MYLWKHVVILERVNSIRALSVYQVHAVQVVNYFQQVIHVVHHEILVTHKKFVMGHQLKYVESSSELQFYYFVFSVRTMTAFKMVHPAKMAAARVFMGHAAVRNNNVLTFGDQVDERLSFWIKTTLYHIRRIKSST